MSPRSTPVPTVHPIGRALLLSLPLLVSCTDKEAADKAKAEEEDAGQDGAGGDGGTEPDPEDYYDIESYPYKGWVNGNVTVTLAEEDMDGERRLETWEEAGYTEFPFGALFVGAYTAPTESAPTQLYAGTETIDAPEMGTSPYQMRVGTQAESNIIVYAALDVLGDGVIGSEDPRGVFPEALLLSDGAVFDDVNIDILALNQPEIVCSDAGTVTITGTVTVSLNYFGGPIGVMLVDEAGNGPFHVVTVEPPTTGEGARASYSLEVCADYGPMRLVAAWDGNRNGLFDPNDKWGVFSTDGANDSNPVFVGNANMNNYPIHIPLGEGPGVTPIQFARLSGQVRMAEGSFAELAAGTDVHVVALTSRPSREFEFDSPLVLDSQKFSWAELSGAASKDFSLLLPANSFVYLWAFADTNADGLLNDVGEPVGTVGADGRVPTGEGFGGIDIAIANVVDPG
jgi:hypothetical protein